MSANSAFEAITSRMAWTTSAAIDKYEAVMVGTDGLLAPATGAAPFVGIAQYPAAAAGDMCTVVTGIFPCMASAAITAGARVKCDASNAGKCVTAAAADDAVGVALMDIATGTIGSILMVDSNGTAA